MAVLTPRAAARADLGHTERPRKQSTTSPVGPLQELSAVRGKRFGLQETINLRGMVQAISSQPLKTEDGVAALSATAKLLTHRLSPQHRPAIHPIIKECLGRLYDRDPSLLSSIAKEFPYTRELLDQTILGSIADWVDRKTTEPNSRTALRHGVRALLTAQAECKDAALLTALNRRIEGLSAHSRLFDELSTELRTARLAASR